MQPEIIGYDLDGRPLCYADVRIEAARGPGSAWVPGWDTTRMAFKKGAGFGDTARAAAAPLGQHVYDPVQNANMPAKPGMNASAMHFPQNPQPNPIHNAKPAIPPGMEEQDESTPGLPNGTGEEADFLPQLIQMLQQHPEHAEEILTQAVQEHPELAEMLQQFLQENGGGEDGGMGGAGPPGAAMPPGGETGGGPPPEMPKPGEQNAAYSVAGRVGRTAYRGAKEVAGIISPFYGAVRSARRVVGYDLDGRPLCYADEEEPKNKDGEGEDMEGAQKKINDGVGEAVDDQPPEGHEEWLVHLEHAMKTHPQLAMMVKKCMEEDTEGTPGEPGEPAESPLPEPGEQNALGMKTGLGTAVGGTLGAIGGSMIGHPFAGAAAGGAIGAGMANRGAFDSPDTITENRGPAGKPTNLAPPSNVMR